MFGSLGLPELLVLGVLAGFATLFMRRGALEVTGPVLVLRKFEVNPSGSPAVIIEGRPSGLSAWLLTTLGVDTLTTLTVTDQQVSIKKGSLSGEIHDLAPTTQIASTHCGYSQPIWILILGGVILLLSTLAALNSRYATQTFIAGILVAGVCGLIYLLQRKVAITIRTTAGGRPMSLAFKPSVIEQVSINLEQALRAVDRLNKIVVEVSVSMRRLGTEKSSPSLTAGGASTSGPKAEPRPKSCRKCGSDLAPEQTFCAECGAKVD